MNQHGKTKFDCSQDKPSFLTLHVGERPVMNVCQPKTKDFLVTCIHITRKKLSACSSGTGSYDHVFLDQRPVFFFLSALMLAYTL